MGQITQQNEAITPVIIPAMDKVMGEMWETSELPADKEICEELMAFTLVGFYGALRRKEFLLSL